MAILQETPQHRIALITNPQSGQLIRQGADEYIRELCEHTPFCCVQDIEGGIDEALICATESQASAIAIAGGDGTIRAVAEWLIRQGLEIPILPLPLGTANLLARRLYGDRDTATILHEAAGYRLDTIPAGILNGRLFLVAAAIGFPAMFARAREVMRDSDRPRPLISGLKRAAASWRQVFMPRVRYRIDRQQRESRQRASGVYLAIRQDDSTGFDCVIVHWRHFWDLLGMPWDAMAVNDSEYAATRRIRVERLAARSRKVLDVMVDGEPFFVPGPVRIRMAPRPLAVLRPDS